MARPHYSPLSAISVRADTCTTLPATRTRSSRDVVGQRPSDLQETLRWVLPVWRAIPTGVEANCLCGSDIKNAIF